MKYYRKNIYLRNVTNLIVSSFLPIERLLATKASCHGDISYEVGVHLADQLYRGFRFSPAKDNVVNQSILGQTKVLRGTQACLSYVKKPLISPSTSVVWVNTAAL